MACSIWNELSIFWSGILTLKLWIYGNHASKTAMIFFHIILHSAALISDFHIFITSSSSFSRVYNEPIQRPAPGWLVNSVARALHRKNTTTFSDDPFLPDIFHWNDPKIRVLFTFHPDCLETLCMVNNAYLCQRVIKRRAEVNFAEIRYKSCLWRNKHHQGCESTRADLCWLSSFW